MYLPVSVVSRGPGVWWSYGSGHAKHQYLARRVERATHLGENKAERDDGVQVVLPELAIEAGMTA